VFTAVPFSNDKYLFPVNYLVNILIELFPLRLMGRACHINRKSWFRGSCCR